MTSREIFVVDGLRMILRAEGYEVSVVANGKDALDHLTSASPWPQVILLDMMLPVMDGWRFLEKVENLKLTPKVNIIVMTGNGVIGKEWAVAHGCRDIIRKPIEVEALLAAVKESFATQR
jgi:two-component system, chemotaxis family, chemotaxis protein CheY